MNPIPEIELAIDDVTFLRSGVTAAFFLPVPLATCAADLLEAFRLYMRSIPAGTLRWSAIGADADDWRRVGGATQGKCEDLLTGSSPGKRKLTAFVLTDGREGGDAPMNGIQIIGNPVDRREPNELCLLQLYFSREVAADVAVAGRFLAWIVQLANGLPYVYGYVSPGLHWSEQRQLKAFGQARALTKRYPGFDFQFNEMTRSDLGRHVRGARWLSFLGQDLALAVGQDALARAPRDLLSITDLPGGLLLQAGALPEIGDVNRGLGVPGLSAMAHLLRPVTLFNEPELQRSNFERDDPGYLEVWEQRFFR